MTRYYTVEYIDKHPSYDYDIYRIEHYTEDSILEEYWSYWIGKIIKLGRMQIALSSNVKEHCIEDWCMGQLAARNHWLEAQDLYT
jgi:hypothetical protein